MMSAQSRQCWCKNPHHVSHKEIPGIAINKTRRKISATQNGKTPRNIVARGISGQDIAKNKHKMVPLCLTNCVITSLALPPRERFFRYTHQNQFDIHHPVPTR